MDKGLKNKLLHDRRVVEEINRHLWLESEKAGCDIGFEKAAQDWLVKFSKAWMKHNMPKRKISARKTPTSSRKTNIKESHN